MLTFQPQETRYSIELTVDQFLDIEARDTHEDTPLYETLDKLYGVHDTDYNGHFGPSIFLTIGSMCDTIELKEKITNIILSYIAGN
jgi:hypothetical protein